MSEFNPLNLSGKNFIITGAASGIGKATAVLLSKLNADLVLLDINKKGLEETLTLCKKTDLALTVNLADNQALNKTIKEATEIKGKFDGFAHIAGIPSIAPLKMVDNQLCEKIMEINTFPAIELAKTLSNKRFCKEDGASFVLISSVYANVGSAANVAYSMSKSAIQGITKSLAIELAPKNIRVNCIAPGFIKTKMGENISHFFNPEHDKIIEELHPLVLGEATDIANGIAFLLSDAAKWITGSIINIDGGFCAK